ncbi:MAG: TonB-dependent receptor [Alphaproteobacteria bacterium]|nr:TonB-dependent receptor [Alphaproteobacteria bacterium]MBV9371324.1 TonB-dependent receptor [Alphaproteobacteria bacterium]MBV9901788.1 TonB-dependent receptor [Alphaproteobacteria bacterium]
MMPHFAPASRLLKLALLSCTLCPAAAWAQGRPPADPAETTTQPPEGAAGDTVAQGENDSTTIVVTGTSRGRAAINTPLAVTTFDDSRLAKLNVSSQADVLNSIPTIKADAGGGEVASNVFIRGLPSGGQYQFTPLMYDGIPVLSTFGLNSSAYDVYYRNDLGIDRLEFVRGGVSNLFGPGSVAGLINYISKTGGDEHHGVIQLEAAERGRYRGDVAVSGPLGDNLHYAVSGYYRSDRGPLRTGLDTEGGQIRANLKYRFADGSGSIILYGQWIDDQVQFYLPIPLNGTTRSRVAGNDGKKVFSVQTPAVAGIGYNTPDGPFQTDITDGVRTRGGQLALVFDKKLGDGWGLNGRIKYSDYKHRFGLSSDGDGVINVPETLQSFLTNRGLGSLANATFTFADDNSAVPANYLLFANRFTDRNRPMHDFTAEMNLTKDFATGSADHTFTLGGFYGDAAARDVNVTTRYLAEFNNRPRLVSLTIRNPTTGALTVVSRGGLLDASVANYVNNRAEAKRSAVYVADQIDAGRFLFDIGGRIEHFRGDIRRERVSTVVTDSTTPNLTTALRDVSWGNDAFLTGRVSTTEWALAAGALYKLTPELNLYANASRGYFFPEIRSVQFALPLPTPVTTGGSPGTQSYTGEIIKQAEVGLKFHNGRVTATLAGLYTKLDNRRQVNFINAPGGGFTEQVNLVATESYGLEATLSLRLLDSLRFDGNLTLQHHEYTQFMANGTTSAFVGNELERQPNILYNAGLYYDDDRLDASIFTNYTGNNFTAANNAIELDGFNIVTFDAGYKFRLGGDRAVRIGVNVFNLFDIDAVTEGSPRQDVNQTTGGAYFVGRPVLPRRITARATFSF